jgi:hypothetical protein
MITTLTDENLYYIIIIIIIIIYILYFIVIDISYASPPFLVGVSATAIALGHSHTCVIEAGGGVKCWGANGFGQLGIGSTTFQTSPVAGPGA